VVAAVAVDGLIQPKEPPVLVMVVDLRRVEAMDSTPRRLVREISAPTMDRPQISRGVNQVVLLEADLLITVVMIYPILLVIFRIKEETSVVSIVLVSSTPIAIFKEGLHLIINIEGTMSTDPREVITIKEEVVIMGMVEGEATMAIYYIYYILKA
jgi:hypothetical protein